jgi:hypothetical protein
MGSATTEHDAWGGYHSSPFFLSGEDRIQLACTYQIETVEEQIAGLSFVA